MNVINIGCEVCQLTDNLKSISRCTIEHGTVTIEMLYSELRCPRHIKYIKCAYCHIYHDGCTVMAINLGDYIFPLCIKHSFAKLCKQCEQWEVIGLSESISIDSLEDRYCKCHIIPFRQLEMNDFERLKRLRRIHKKTQSLLRYAVNNRVRILVETETEIEAL
jgi:hypothetical protein